MLPLVHFAVSAALAAILFPFYGWYSLLVFVGGFLIDVDHYVWYAVKFRDLNVKNSYGYLVNLVKKKDTKGLEELLCVFHSVEFILLLLIASFFFKKIFLVVIGLAVHLILDFIGKKKLFDGVRIDSITLWLKNEHKKRNKK